ncbi:hypothetical protein FQR65_LT13419 [Abscondita terminalis]|nr:hypothetical protein FQR65_LT13419 [Abscondita terminalis]
MTKLKLALSRPRKSKKLIMKKLSEKRWKTLAQMEAVNTNDTADETCPQSSCSSMSCVDDSMQCSIYSSSDGDSVDQINPETGCDENNSNMVSSETGTQLVVDDESCYQSLDTRSECCDHPSELDISTRSDESDTRELLSLNFNFRFEDLGVGISVTDFKNSVFESQVSGGLIIGR